jgi:Fic family protein
MRSGQFIKQVEGYTAFIPAALPPNPPINRDSELRRLLSDADRALGRLDGVISMYVRQEAVLSSQIEGTQSS